MAYTDRTLRPFRDYDEHDVINLYRLNDAATLPVHRGTLVKLADTTGWVADAEDGISMLGGAGDHQISNVVSQRYGVASEAAVCGAGEQPLGMTLYDVRETDENGERLQYNPRKAVEMECVLSGQAVPIVTKGIFLYSGALLVSDAPDAGDALYAGADGKLTKTITASEPSIGRTLGKKDGNGHVLVQIDVNNWA